ncbi:MAG: hypothetical protein RR376_19985 [Janthinobacterium sp.]
MQHIDTIALQGSIDEMRTRIAIEQSAMHKVKLGVARWRGDLPALGADAPVTQAPACAASQVRWHAEAQCHFMCWLADGGFAREDEDVEMPGLPALAQQTVAAQAMPKETTAQAKPSATPILPAHCNDCPA